MSFKTAAVEHNGAVIKTKIGIPRNSCIKNKAIIQRQNRRQNAITQQKKQKKNQFPTVGRENGAKKIFGFMLNIQSLNIGSKVFLGTARQGRTTHDSIVSVWSSLRKSGENFIVGILQRQKQLV